MSRFRPNWVLFLLVLFVSSSTPFALSSQDTVQELVDGNRTRSLNIIPKVNYVGNSSNSSSNSNVLILAANRTHRKDPSDGFKYYTGGWNLTNPHYAYSVGYSAAPLFITAVLWLVLLGIFLILMCLWRCCCCCFRKKKAGYSQVAYAVSLTLLIVFTAGAITGSVFLYTGQDKFHTSIGNVVNFLLQEVQDLIQKLTDLAGSLVGAKRLGVGSVKLPDELQATIDQLHGQLGDMTNTFVNVTANATKKMNHFLNPVRFALLSVSSFTLVLVLLGFLFSILGLECLVSVLTLIAWIAVFGTFFLSGLFLLIHNAVADTCVAVEDFLQNPTANSAIENLMPRANEDLARGIMNGTRGVTYALVNTTNVAIFSIYNQDLPPDAGPLYFNQSGPLMPLLCNPFDLTLHDRQCEPGEVDFLKAPEVWKSFTCQVSDSGICITPGRLTPYAYNNLTTSLNVSYALYHYGPFLADLVDSTYMKQIFSKISNNYCPGLKKYSEWTYAGFTAVSTFILLSVILWIIFVRERNHRKYTKKYRKKNTDSENPFANGAKKW